MVSWIGHQKAQIIKEKADKLDTKILKACISKDNIKKMKRKPTEWEKIFTNYVLDKVLACRIYKELFQHKNVRTYNSILKLVKDFNRHLFREDIQMTNKHMKRRSRSLVIREIQIKTTMRYHFTSTKMGTIKNNQCWDDMEKLEHSCVANSKLW